jgi:uncharacterized protein YktA (UPF0223 family)
MNAEDIKKASSLRREYLNDVSSRTLSGKELMLVCEYVQYCVEFYENEMRFSDICQAYVDPKNIANGLEATRILKDHQKISDYMMSCLAENAAAVMQSQQKPSCTNAFLRGGKTKCFIFHDWSKWDDKESGGAITFQERRCKNCNMLEKRSVRSTL